MNGVDTYQGVIIGGTYSTIVTVNNVRQQFTNPYRLHGEMNVFANGTYKQGMGYLAVGMADADGIMRIAGGTALKDAEFMKAAAVHGEPNGEILIGVCGGNGLVEVTGGGTVDFKGKLFAGGVDPAGLRVPRTWSSLNTASTASTGTVRVVDGTFAVSGAMTLGARGTGILEVGSNGVVNASSLVMSNNVESVLSFKFGPDGIGCVNLVGGLEITPGAKLKVDASEYTGTESRRFPLVLADSVSGSFASVEYDNRKLRMTFREDGLYATVNPAGFVLVVR